MEKTNLFNRIYENDVIQITDRDILNSMAFTLYGMKYDEVLKEIKKERNELIDELLEEINLRKEGKGHMTSFSIGGFELWKQDQLSFLIDKFNFYKSSMFITDIFRVTETEEEYFKIGLLGKYVEDEFKRVGKIEAIKEFLEGLKFPYTWEYKSFFKLGCPF